MVDIRFPTSLEKDGSDASNIDSLNLLICLVNKRPDYSAAFVILRTNVPNLKAYGLILFSLCIVQCANNITGMSFTSGSGNEVVCLAMETLAQRIVGKSLAELTANMGHTWRTLVSGQIRWIGPEVPFPHAILLHPTFFEPNSDAIIV